MSKKVEIKVVDWTENIKIVGILSLILIAGIGTVLYMRNPESVLVLLILSLLFLPLGVILGFLFFNPYMRIKILRALTRKNYGFLNIVMHGKIIKKIVANLDQAYVLKDKCLWVITPEAVYNTVTGERHNIVPEHIHFESGVPEIFVNYENMTPILIENKKEVLRPGEIGSVVLEYISVQTSKDVYFQRKRLNLIAVIVLILAGLVAYVILQNMQIMNELKKIEKPRIEGIKVVDFTNKTKTGGLNASGNASTGEHVQVVSA